MHDIKRCMFICDFPVFIIESVVLTATVVVSCSVFWLFNALLLTLDLTGRPQYLLRYKIQEGKNQPVRHVSCRVRLNVASCGKSFVRLIHPVKWRHRICGQDKGSPHSITECRVLELIPVLGSQPAGDVSHKPGSRLPLLSARPAVTPATLKRAATSFAAWTTEAGWVWTVCLRLLSDSIAAAIWTRALLRLSPAH